MRLAFVVYGSLDQISGGFIYDRALIDGLRGLGHQVDVFGLRWDSYFTSVARNAVLGHPLRPPPQGGSIYDAVIQDELVHPSVCLTNRSRGAWPRGGRCWRWCTTFVAASRAKRWQPSRRAWNGATSRLSTVSSASAGPPWRMPARWWGRPCRGR
jgi:hypothetical protein